MTYPNQVNLWDLQQRKFKGEDDTPDYMRQADVYAQEKEDAYQEALKGVPDEPNPSVWRRLAAGALGAFGGYHSQFVDPRQTQTAVQTVLQGDYPMRYKKAQEEIKRAEVGMGAADRLRQRANERYRSEQEAKARTSAAESLAESRRQAEENKWDTTMTARGGIPVDEAELESPAIKAQLEAGTHIVKRGPGGRVLLMPTVTQLLKEQQAIKKAASFSPSVYAEIRKHVPSLPENQDFATKDDIDMARQAYNQMVAGERQDKGLAARMAELGMRLGHDSAKTKADAALELLKSRAKINLWNDTNKQYSALENEQHKYEDAIKMGKFINGSVEADQKRYADIRAEQARILELAHRRDAQLSGEDEEERLRKAGIKSGAKSPAVTAAEPAQAATPAVGAATGESATVTVRNPQGVVGVIPRAQLAAAKAQGYTEVK